MAITLAQTITAANDNPVYLSADTNAPAFKIDDEQFLVVAHAGNVTNRPFQPDGQNSGGGAYGNAAITVARGWNGTDPGPHAAGATATPLFYSMASTQGATV